MNTQKSRESREGFWKRFFDSPAWWSLKASRTAQIALVTGILLIALALGAPVLSTQNPFDLATIDISFANLPPSWTEEGDPAFLFGTDDQGRDLWSAMLYGMRLSLAISVAAVALSILLGVSLGLLAGFAGGWTESIIMRICDIMLSFPAILLALLIDGILRAALPPGEHTMLPYMVLVAAITLSGWVPYARTVRSMTLVERNREYVLSARVIGVKRPVILWRHILPNVLGPVFVLATLHVATAILTEATLSFLGVGVPPTTPSLGTLIRIGSDFLFSGEWWITIIPGAALVALILSVNLVGDWLRDAFNPALTN
ncbi:ABC transporter permease [Sutterella sp.]|uniref:ABC transporter permease n=1 Tax=Sutterella sp. TaxID=1981025 RepID=UPI0026E0FB86|nr:ABC transporter permease [Sutterella sp.]MDO5532647.1 ABC transporter permease [Sutterella sp.]